MNIQLIKTNLEKECLELSKIMKHAFDDDTRLHTDLEEDGPYGYDDGSLLKKLCCEAGNESYTVYADKKIAGFLCIIPENDQAELEMLFIDPQRKNEGIGKEVMKQLFSMYSHINKWHVLTPKYSARNIHFYEKCGFILAGEKDYGDGDVAVKLVRKQ